MPKYFSGRKKRTPQSGLTSDRYEYLSIEQAEPNLGDPPEVDNIPTGIQYQIVSVANHPGKRYWRTLTGGIQPGAITVREEGTILPNAEGISSITDINFKGNILTAEGYLQPDGTPGIGVTITAAPIGENHDVIFNNNGEFGAATGGLTYDNDNTRVGIASTQPDQTLDIDGSLFISGNVFDKSKTNSGTENQVLVRHVDGGLVWADQSTTGVSDAAGDPTQVQYHGSDGKITGGKLLVYDYTNGITDERVGIGSTQPTRLLDVLGNSRFVGVTTFVGDVFVEGVVTSEDVTNIDSLGIVTARKGVRVSDDGLVVVGFTTLENTRILHDKALYFGKDDANNLEIKFDGTDSVINDISSTNLGFKLQQGGNTKLEVTQSGIIVTGVTTTDILSVTGLVTSHLIPSPSTVGNFDLGSQNNRWDNIWANNINVGSYNPVTLVVEQLKVTGISTLSNLEVSGMSTFIGLSTFNDGLEVISGVTTFAGITTVTGETLFAKQFSVAGVSSIGIGSANSLYVSGLSTFVGFSTFKDDVFVAGVSTFIGFSTFRNDIHVTGLSTFVGFSTFVDAIVGGMSTFVGISSFEGNVSFNAGIRDKDGDLGGNGWILESRDNKVNWVAPAGLSVENAEKVGIGSTDKSSTYYPAFVKNNNEHDNRQNEYLYNTHDFIYSYNENAGIGSVGIGTNIIADDTTLNVTGITSFKGNVYFNGVKNTIGFTSLTWQSGTGILKFQDEVKAYFGNGNDLRIYHTEELKGTSDNNGDPITDNTRCSYIHEKGSGGLIFKSDGGGGPGAFQFFGEDWKPLLKLHSGNKARALLYYNGLEKLQTIGTGVTITGITTTNSLSVSGISSFWGPVWDEDGSPGQSTYLLSATSTGVKWKPPENITVENSLKVGVGTTGAVSAGGTSIYYPTFVDSNNEIRDLEYLYSNRGLSYNVYYEDGNDVGISSVGIGTSTPRATLDVLGITSFRGGDVNFNGANANVFWDHNNSYLTADNGASFTFGQFNTNDFSTRIYGNEQGNGYWDATNGTGNIYIWGSSVEGGTHKVYINPNKAQDSITATANAGVQLYYAGLEKIKTISNGIQVTGKTDTDDLYVSGDAHFAGGVKDKDGNYGEDGQLLVATGTDGKVDWKPASDLTLENASKVGVGSINAADPGIGTHFITFVDENHPYDDRKNEKIYSTGLFVYDPQDNGRVGIGTTIPSDTLSVLGISSFTGNVYFNGTDENNLGITSLTWRRSEGILEFKTNVIARFGDDDGDNDPGLEIYHNGTDSIIHDNGEGNLNLKTGESSIQLLGNDTESMVVAKANSSVELYYDSAKKLETSGIGITVTGITSTNQLMVKGVFYDGLYKTGTTNQVLTSQGGSVKWTDPDDLSADNANRIKTCGVTTDRTYHLTFVEDNNTSGTDPNPGALEAVYTGVGITFNANNDYLYLGGSLHLDGTGADTDGDIHSWGGSDGEFAIINEGAGAIHLLVQDNDPSTPGIGIVSFTAENNAKRTYFASNVNPKTNEIYNLAESNAHRWANVYVKNYHGEFLSIYDSDNSNKITIQAPATGDLTADYTLTLPVDGGNPNEVLKTDGNGVLSWTTNSPGTPTAAGDDKQVQFNDKSSGSSVLSGAVGLEWDKDDKTLNSSVPLGAWIKVEKDSTQTAVTPTTSSAQNYAALTADGALELKRTDDAYLTSTGPYIDFKSGGSDADARIEMQRASDNTFSSLMFYTGGGGSSGGDVVERLRIGKVGEIGIDAQGTGRTSDQIYGTNGQVLKSGGFGSSVYWADESGSGGGGLASVQVKQYSDDLSQSDPRTVRTCDALDAPITVATSGNTAIIGIGSTSNAYGNRYVGDTEPTGNLCEGDIWYDTSASASAGANDSTGTTRVAKIYQTETTGTGGGTYSNPGDLGTWKNRTLNSTTDPKGIVTLDSGHVYFAVPAGSYEIKWDTPAYMIGNFQSRLQYDDNSSFSSPTSILGSSEHAPSQAGVLNPQESSTGIALITVSETTYIRIQIIGSGTTNDANVLGKPSNISGATEIYTQVSVEDLATAVKNAGDDYVSGTSRHARIYDRKPSSDSAGAPDTLQAWRTRSLNTKDDPTGLVTLETGSDVPATMVNQIFSLPAGTYRINWRCPAHDAANVRTQLVHDTDITFPSGSSNRTEILGESGYSDTADPGESNYYSCGSYIITTTQKEYFVIQQYQDAGNWGQASQIGDHEIYTQIFVEDLKTAVKENGGSGGGGSSTSGMTKVAELWDEKTSGTHGGTFTLGDWRDRTLNKENDPQDFVTLESNNVSFSLPSGTYNIKWSAPAYNVNMHKTRLVYANNSDFNSATYIQGSSEFDSSNISTNSQTRSFGDTQLTITEKTYFKIQHRSHDTQADWGLGSAANFPNSPEIYTQVSIEDLATAVKDQAPAGSDVPVGGIIMYSGTKTALDALTNWILCDDSAAAVSAGAPDLRDKFIIGANQYNSGWKTNVTGSLTPSGGSKDAVVVQHNHGITEPNDGQGHLHNVAYSNSDSGDGVIEESGIGVNGYEPTEYATTGITINNEGVAGTDKNLPPYFALAYIMRIS